MEQTGKRFCFKCGFVAAGEETVCPLDGARLTSIAADPYIGKSVCQGKYEVLELLGKGGMSIVYKVRHAQMNRLEALKMLRNDLVSDRDALLRFQRESKAATTLRHANIVRVLDFGLLENQSPFLTMELLQGEDLQNLLKSEGTFSPDRAVNLFAQICDGLYHAHQNGIIHRDIKPSNIIIVSDRDGRQAPVIVDFGIAKMLDCEGSPLGKVTTTGQVFGSPLYMSPEQCSSKNANERSDIYSVGCMLYQCLTGVPPLQGNTPVETMMRQMQQKPKPFALVKPDHAIPQALEKVVFKSLSKDAESRYRDMNEFRKALLLAVNLPADDLPAGRSSAGGDTLFSSDTAISGRHLSGKQASADRSKSKSETGYGSLVTKPVFQIGLVFIVLGLVGVVALFFLPSQKRPDYADDSMAVNPVGRHAAVRVTQTALTPCLFDDFSNLGESWGYERSGSSLLSKSKPGVQERGTIYQISLEGDDSMLLVERASMALGETGMLDQINAPQVVTVGSASQPVKILSQTLVYKSAPLDARVCRVLYYKNKDSGDFMALHIVPGKEGSKSIDSLFKKIAPRFHL